jgi:hypothetical protein
VSVKGSCTYFAPIDGGEIPRGCTDYSDNYTDGTADAAACTSEGGTWSTASCSHVGVTFGCEEFGIGGGASDCSLVTSWYYDSGSCIGGTVPVSP